MNSVSGVERNPKIILQALLITQSLHTWKDNDVLPWVDIKSLFLGNCIDEAGETKANQMHSMQFYICKIKHI